MVDLVSQEYIAQAIAKAAEWRLPSGEDYTNSSSIDLNVTAVIGGGTMGRGIAIALSLAGFETIVVEQNEDAMAFCRKEVDIAIKREQSFGRMKEKQVELVKKIKYTTDLNQLSQIDLVIEAVFENMKLKKELLTKLDKIIPEEAIVGTNTSSLDIDALSQCLKNPKRLVGIHFFNPPHVIRMVEIVHGKYTSGQAVATAVLACTSMKKLPVLVGNCPSFVFNRLLAVYINQAHKLLYEHGILPKDLDALVKSRGFLMGPLTMHDMNGIDVTAMLKAEHKIPLNPLEEFLLKKHKRYGRKTGRGFYKYDPETRKKEDDPEMEQFIKEYSSSINKNTYILSDSDAIDFLLCPMVNEGFLCLEENLIADESLIDIMFVLGFGWPPGQGGPMRWARTRGLHGVLEYVKKLHAAEPESRAYLLSKKTQTYSKL